jgi:hypothetical protein
MTNAHRLSTIGVVIVCLAVAQANVTLFASEDTSSQRETPSSSLVGDTSQTQESTSDVPAATDQSLTPSPLMERTRLTLDTGFLVPNPLAQSVQQQFAPTEAVLTGQIYQGRPYRMGRNGSIAAIMIGAAATITGAALLIYANRPDCETNQFAGGCGYGTKVIGGSVLAGGVVGLFVGALTWR